MNGKNRTPGKSEMACLRADGQAIESGNHKGRTEKDLVMLCMIDVFDVSFVYIG